MRKILLLLLLSLTLITLVSAAEWDNVKSYDPVLKEVTLKNALGLPLIGDNIAKVKLDSPLVVKVGLGYQKVAEFTIDSYSDYPSFIQEFEIKNVRTGKVEDKQIDLKYKSTKQVLVPEYKEVCLTSGDLKNATQICNLEKSGEKYETQEEWLPLEKLDVKAEKITVGIFTETKEGDYYDWIPTFAGVKVTEWAVWTASLNTALVSYYAFEQTGEPYLDSITTTSNDLTGKVGTVTSTASGKIGRGIDIADGNNYLQSESNMGITGSQSRSVCFWADLDTIVTEYYYLFWGHPTQYEIFAPGYYSSSGYYQMVATNNQDVKSGVSGSTNSVFHCYQYNGTTLLFWNDGVNIKNVTVTNTLATGDSNLTVGAYMYSGTIHSIDGVIDELGIWNRSLSGAEIVQLYNGGTGMTYDSGLPIITLNSPIDVYNSSSQSMTFNASVVSFMGISNVTLYLNGILNETNTSGINNTAYIFSKTISDGNHNWSIKSCNSGGCKDSATRTFTIDITKPVLSDIALNASTIYNVGDLILLNTTATDTNLDDCWYDYNGVNTTIAGCLTGLRNQTAITTVASQTAITVWANDTSGNIANPYTVNFTFDSTPPTISISSPSSLVDYLYENYNQTLTFTATDTNLDDCWYDYNGTNKTIACSTGVAKTDYYNQSIGKYDIRVWANDTLGNKASTLLSYSAKVIENSRTSDASTFDTATANYGVNVTANSSLTGINLFYDGTSYALTNQGSGIWNISRQLPTSSVGTQSFQYKFQYGTETITSYNSTQTVTATVLAECDGVYTTKFLNLTFKDENTLTAINATIPTSSFVYYLGNGTVNKTLSYSNNSLNYNYSFCGTSGALPLTVYPTIQYKQGTAYPQRIWTPSAQSYSSSLTNQTLYLLGSSDGLYVTFQVIDNSDATISGVEVNVSRIVDGSTVLISSGTTDSGGLVTFWLNPDFQHTLTFTKSGYTSYTTSLFPTQSSYTVTLGGSTSTPVGETAGISYGMSPTEDFLTYFTVHDFVFTIGSSYWDLDEFGYDLNWSNGTLIDTQSSTDSSGGTLTSSNINVSNASSIIMSPYYIIDSVKYSIGSRYWYLQSSEGREFSLYQWFGDFTTYTSTGTSVLGFNDFGKLLLTALVLILLVGGLSQRYGLQSEAAITGILFSVIFFLEYSLEWIPQISTPLGTLPRGTLTIISGIILVATMIAGERR